MRTRLRNYTGKLTALMLIPIIALTITSVTYSHWQQTLTITGTIKTGKAEAKIICYKVCSLPCLCRITDCRLSDDNQTLNIQLEKVKPCCYIGIAMTIKNTGTIPLLINNNTYTITDQDGNDIKGNFTLKQWFIGPFNGECPVKDDPPESDDDYCTCPWLKNPPIQLDPDWKLLTLMFIHRNFTSTSQYQIIHIKIKLNYKIWTG